MGDPARSGGRGDGGLWRRGGHPQQDHSAERAQHRPHPGVEADGAGVHQRQDALGVSDAAADRVEGGVLEAGDRLRAALVRDIQPPSEIAALISQREQADQEMERSTNRMEEAKSEALLVEQQEMADRNASIGDFRTKVVTVTKEAEQRKGVSITEASRALEVSRLQLEAAEKEAAAIRSRGEAEAKVILFGYQAKAEPLGKAVAAFGDGMTYAQYFFLQKTAPAIQSIASNTDGPFAEIFKEFQSFGRTSSVKEKR